MRVLLDSNVWRYIADADAAGRLQALARKRGHRIAIAPPVIYEALRMQDATLRRHLCEVMTRPAWDRLMPDAYSEAVEFKQEVRRLRPAWVRETPDLMYFKRLRSDWRKPTGGFWSRARQMPEREHEKLSALDGDMMPCARANAARQRKGIADSDRAVLDTSLDAIVGQPSESVDGWDGEPVSIWRLHAWSFMTEALQNTASPHYEWLSGEVDLTLALFRSGDWTRFWFYEVEANRLPRFWLRSAFEFMQSFYKVTDGTPVDAQLGSYAVEADVVVSADRRFTAMCQRCQHEAPFRVGDVLKVGGGRTGVEELLAFLD